MKRWIEAGDLYRALGGYKVAVQLLDKNKDGIPDQGLVEGVLEDACSIMATLIEKRVELASLSAPYPRALVANTSWLAAWCAWGEGSDGQAMPDIVDKRNTAAMAWGKGVGSGDTSVGTVVRPELDPPAHSVDPDPHGFGISMKGFKRGFM